MYIETGSSIDYDYFWPPRHFFGHFIDQEPGLCTTSYDSKKITASTSQERAPIQIKEIWRGNVAALLACLLLAYSIENLSTNVSRAMLQRSAEHCYIRYPMLFLAGCDDTRLVAWLSTYFAG
jgi:hypothetical protein